MAILTDFQTSHPRKQVEDCGHFRGRAQEALQRGPAEAAVS